MDFFGRVVSRNIDKNNDGRLQGSEMVAFDLEMLASDMMALDAWGYIGNSHRLAMYSSMTVERYQAGSMILAQRHDLWPNGVEIPSRIQSQLVVESMHRVAAYSQSPENLSTTERAKAVVGSLSDNARANVQSIVSAFQVIFRH